MEEDQPAPPSQKRGAQRRLVGFLVLLFGAVLPIAGLLFVKYRQAVNNNPSVQRDQILSDVGSKVALPNETPTVSTILDKSKITNATLAGEAQNGDKLLIYANARRIVL